MFSKLAQAEKKLHEHIVVLKNGKMMKFVDFQMKFNTLAYNLQGYELCEQSKEEIAELRAKFLKIKKQKKAKNLNKFCKKLDKTK